MIGNSDLWSKWMSDVSSERYYLACSDPWKPVAVSALVVSQFVDVLDEACAAEMGR